MRDFVHLHVHTEYSLLDGAAQIHAVIQKAKSLGQKALAITDHGVMYGVVEFYKEAVANGIKPIIGCEVYTAARTRFDKMYELDSQIGHLILLAKNNEGYKNLIYIVSKASTEGMYYKPRVDTELLRSHSEGIIALSACLAGEVQRLLLQDNYSGAKEKALEYADIFKDGFYLELQDHNLKEDESVISGLKRLAGETGLPLVATNDVHYVERQDAKVQNVLMCIQMNKTVHDQNALSFETEEFYLKSGDEMETLFADCPEALDNTVKIAEECNVTFDFEHYHLPSFPLDESVDHFEYLKNLAYDGLKSRYPNTFEEYQDRLEYELSVISQMGYVDYFLIVYDFIHYAKTHDIPVGPGRGSGAGSIVAYCLHITEIDPMRFNLLFERFLNPERVSMPDIDVDFCVEKRGQVIDYVVSKYGAQNVAQIITFGTMAAKAAVRDVGRALGVPYATADRVAKMVPFGLSMTLKTALKGSKDLKHAYDTEPEVRELIDMALRLEGFPRHASTHAAGVVITKNPVYHYVPVQLSDNATVTQFPMTQLEELGLLKMDFLGLRNLTVIRETERLVQQRLPEFSLQNISFEDQKVFSLLSSGKTQGIFQLESDGIRQVIMRIKPRSIEDIIAVISLYRPGPMDSIPKYIENKHHPEKIKYIDSRLHDILGVTYGCIVYQEQVMQIVRELAGYSYGRADLVRRAMSKKKMDVMQREREIFINGLTDENGNAVIDGCIRRGISAKTAGKLWDEMSDFAKYAFNKSHAACYASVAYQTAYLKCYYPAEFMASMMTSVMDNMPKMVGYIEECKKLGLKVVHPLINQGNVTFTVKDNTIIFALSAIKNVGRKLVEQIVTERDLNGSFTSFADFMTRLNGQLNRKAVESLIKSGAFDEFGFSRRHLISVYEKVMDAVRSQSTRTSWGQMDLFSDVFHDDSLSLDRFFKASVPEYSTEQKLLMEKEVIGLYMGGHPLSKYSEVYQKQGCIRIQDLKQQYDSIDPNKSYKLFGVLSECKMKTTKTNKSMAFAMLEDESDSIELIVFPNVFNRAEESLKNGNIVFVEGKASPEDEGVIRIICEHIINANLQQYKNMAQKLYLKLPSQSDEKWGKAKEIINAHKGGISCVLYFEDIGKSIATKKDFGVDGSPDLLLKLRGLLGNDHVILK